MTALTFKRWREALAAVVKEFRDASIRLREGDRSVAFPEGTYPSALPFIPFTGNLIVQGCSRGSRWPGSAPWRASLVWCSFTSAVVFLKGGPTGVELRKIETKVSGRVFNTFHYYAFGLSQSLAEEYVDRPQVLAAALAALMRSKIWDKPEKMLRCRKAIRRVELPLSDAYVLDRIVVTQIELTPAEKERYRELEREHGKEVQEMVITWEDALAEQRAEGRAKGRAEGRTEGALEAIVLLAKHHHGQLPDCFAEKLEAIDDLSRLHGILEQVTAVRSLEELGRLVESR